MFVIEDERHSEQHGQFSTLEDAVAGLQKLASIPWDEHPNRAPCQNSKKCGREYEIIEYDVSSTPWIELRRFSGLSISAEGILWSPEFSKKTKTGSGTVIPNNRVLKFQRAGTGNADRECRTGIHPITI